MQLVSYAHDNQWLPGILVDATVIDARTAADYADLGLDLTDFSSRFIVGLSEGQRSLLQESAVALVSVGGPDVHRLQEVTLGPPIPDPDKIICLGLNYRSHAEEVGFTPPEIPILFAKYRNALIGPASPILLPRLSQQIDYEGELAVVIGQRARDIPAAQALDYVAGYMAFNDVSARDLQFRTGQWLSGKSLDTFAPCGPALVMDEVEYPQELGILTRLNGEVLQQGNTRDMIFPIATIIEYISSLMTLEPGDIVATGTPEGVGFKRNPPVFLKDGDLIEVEIERIGRLSNPVKRNK